MNMAVEKAPNMAVNSEYSDSPDGDHLEVTDPEKAATASPPEHGFTTDFQHLPKNYYFTPSFLGSMAGVFFGLMAGVGGYAVAAPILGIINADIGPDQNYVWVALVYSLTLAIGLTFVGRLSDIFGRRWFFIGGAFVAMIGAIVAGTAQSIPTLIGGETLIGLGASTQLSFPFAMGELVPMKHRFLGNAILYLSCFPFSGFGPAVANAVVLHSPAGWRTGYYLLVAIDGVSLLCYVCFCKSTSYSDTTSVSNPAQDIKSMNSNHY